MKEQPVRNQIQLWVRAFCAPLAFRSLQHTPATERKAHLFILKVEIIGTYWSLELTLLYTDITPDWTITGHKADYQAKNKGGESKQKTKYINNSSLLDNALSPQNAHTGVLSFGPIPCAIQRFFRLLPSFWVLFLPYFGGYVNKRTCDSTCYKAPAFIINNQIIIMFLLSYTPHKSIDCSSNTRPDRSTAGMTGAFCRYDYIFSVSCFKNSNFIKPPPPPSSPG